MCVCVCVCRLQIHQDLREELGKVKNLEGLAGVSKQLRLRCQVTAHRRVKKETMNFSNIRRNFYYTFIKYIKVKGPVCRI